MSKCKKCKCKEELEKCEDCGEIIERERFERNPYQRPITEKDFTKYTWNCGCLHENCSGCKNGTCSGVHMISCPCPKCSPRC